MAAYRFFLLVFIVFHVVTVQINAQFCTPIAVVDLAYDNDHILTWKQSENETCAVNYYLVNVVGAAGGGMETFVTDQTILDVGHLPDCVDSWYTVIPVSTDNVEGVSSVLYVKTPPPLGSDISLSFLRLEPMSDDLKVNLVWDVAEEWKYCVAMYRALRYNEDADNEFSMYLIKEITNYAFEVAPCTSYVFTVTALYDLEREGRVSVIRYNAPSYKIRPPQVEGFTVATTTIDLTVKFPGADVNRCPVNSLIVDSTPYFNISYPIASQNQVTRPSMNIRLNNLLPDSMYWFRLYANNTAGASDPYVVGIQTLPN